MNKGGLAVRPDFFNNIPSAIQERAVKASGVSEEERHLHALSSHKGYEILKDFGDRLLEDLDKTTEMGMTQGLSLEEVGRNAVIANLAKGLIKRIFKKVEDAKEACERPDGTVR